MNNQSAALTALKNSETNSIHYEDLIRRGIYLSYDEKFDGILKEVETNKKFKLRGKNLITLMSKSYIGASTSYEEKKKKISSILRAFQILNEIEQIRPILEIFVARPIKIIFDFNRSAIQHLNPESGERSPASSFHQKGYIYIGAKYLSDARLECDVLATLAHKLLHYGLQIIYENDSKPYFQNDIEKKLEFDEISQFCETQKNAEKIIENVFEFDKSEQHAELIARIPHFLAFYHHNDEKRKTFHEKFKKLFAFYDHRVVHDLKSPLSDLRLKNEIYKLNCKLELIKSLREFPIKFKPESLKVNVNLKEKNLIFLTNSPTLATFAIFQRHRVESFYNGSSSSLQSGKSDSSQQIWHQQRLFLYSTIEKIDESEILNQIKGFLKVMETFDCKLSLNIVIKCDGASLKAVRNISKKFQPHKLTFVVDVNENTINRDVLSKTFDLREVNHVWSDLTSQSQHGMMDFEVEFQVRVK